MKKLKTHYFHIIKKKYHEKKKVIISNIICVGDFIYHNRRNRKSAVTVVSNSQTTTLIQAKTIDPGGTNVAILNSEAAVIIANLQSAEVQDGTLVATLTTEKGTKVESVRQIPEVGLTNATVEENGDLGAINRFTQNQKNVVTVQNTVEMINMKDGVNVQNSGFTSTCMMNGHGVVHFRV